MNNKAPSFTRRHFVTGAAATAALLAAPRVRAAESPISDQERIVFPPADKRLLLACKLTMITREAGGKKLTLTERLRMAGLAGFDGVDLDEAGNYTPEQAREAVQQSGVFVHDAINHKHWEVRLTDPNAETREKARANLEHSLRVSHAAGGSGVLIVVGKSDDGPEAEIEERCRAEMKKARTESSGIYLKHRAIWRLLRGGLPWLKQLKLPFLFQHAASR